MGFVVGNKNPGCRCGGREGISLCISFFVDMQIKESVIIYMRSQNRVGIEYLWFTLGCYMAFSEKA